MTSMSNDQSTESISIEKLSMNYPSIPWLEYINTILSPIAVLDQNVTIIVKKPKLMKNLENLLLDTPKRILANYALWRVVEYSTDYLGNKFRKRQNQFKADVTGLTELKPRF